jgi:chromosome segregation ATPase
MADPETILHPEITKVDSAIVTELVTARAHLRNQTDRILDLELALDQTIHNLEDLKNRLLQQDSLENHLAAIEETANIQQQAILQLKHQISQKDLALNQLLQIRIQPQDYDRARAELAEQHQTQALLQQACQELETDREHQQTRILDLETQIAEMQEQILQQMQQGHEYETAIQHWKDRHHQLQTQLQTLKTHLETQPLTPELEKLLTEPTEPKPKGIRPYQDLSVDLPGFLKRWQRRED